MGSVGWRPRDAEKRCQRIAALPIGFGGLARAQFSAVPDDVGLRAALGRLLRQHVDLDPAAIRERPHRIHVGPYRIAVVNEKQHESSLDTRPMVRGRWVPE